MNRKAYEPSPALQRAQETVDAGRAQTNELYRPRYHASVPVGWMNDPNGFCYFGGQYHLYYQHHPYGVKWGPMHWGHFASDDLVRWRDMPIAMAPDMSFDAGGCFSGTALVEDGRLTLLYTGVTEETPYGKAMQHQCVAQSADGIRFEKWAENPVIGALQLPPDASPYDFRDPKLWRQGDTYFALVASQDIAAGGQLLLFASPDMRAWTCRGAFLRGLGSMCECPDFFALDGEAMLVLCLMGVQGRYPSAQPAVYALGRVEGDRFAPRGPLRMLDMGLDFYAPQSVLCPDGGRALVGWMHAWGNELPTDRLGHGWAGVMSLPRTLSVEGGALCQRPIESLRQYREDAVCVRDTPLSGSATFDGIQGRHLELDMAIDLAGAAHFSLRLLEDGNEYVEVSYDVAEQTVTLNRDRMGHSLAVGGRPEERPCATAHAPLADGVLRLQVFVDACTVEVFEGDGHQVMSALAFPRWQGEGVSLHARGNALIRNLCKWTIHPQEPSKE